MKNNNLLTMATEHSDSLFFGQALYELNHTSDGKNIFMKNMSSHYRRKMQIDNMHLVNGIKFSEKTGFPIIDPYDTDDFNFELLPFTERKRHISSNWAIHFFQDDYKFIKAITVDLEQTTNYIKDCKAVFAPDCTLWVNAPIFINQMNIFRSRFAAAYWQTCGINIIQTASWGDANSLKFCLDGLAEHSITAVCGIGRDRSKSTRLLWEHAINVLIEQKSPTKLLVYGGNSETLPSLPVPIIHLEDQITKHFRKK